MFLLSAKMSFNIKKMDNELFPKRFIDTYFVNQNQKLQYNIVFMVLYIYIYYSKQKIEKVNENEFLCYIRKNSCS